MFLDKHTKKYLKSFKTQFKTEFLQPFTDCRKVLGEKATVKEGDLRAESNFFQNIYLEHSSSLVTISRIITAATIMAPFCFQGQL